MTYFGCGLSVTRRAMIPDLPIGVGTVEKMTEGLSDHRGSRAEGAFVDSAIELHDEIYGQGGANLTQASL
ncbi:MAG: hypothetical protein H0U53_02920 [Actinobacteria bacterium]|nr:hypothetical protein [Actinomycetota bacterium]